MTFSAREGHPRDRYKEMFNVTTDIKCFISDSKNQTVSEMEKFITIIKNGPISS